MRLVDANILMYASFDAFPQHEKAKKWLDGALNDDYVPLGIPWESITECQAEHNRHSVGKHYGVCQTGVESTNTSAGNIRCRCMAANSRMA